MTLYNLLVGRQAKVNLIFRFQNRRASFSTTSRVNFLDRFDVLCGWFNYECFFRVKIVDFSFGFFSLLEYWNCIIILTTLNMILSLQRLKIIKHTIVFPLIRYKATISSQVLFELIASCMGSIVQLKVRRKIWIVRRLLTHTSRFNRQKLYSME